MLTILYIIYILSTIISFLNADLDSAINGQQTFDPGLFRLTSTKIQDNKLYALYKYNKDKSAQLRVYELKEELIANIFNDGKTFNYEKFGKGFNLVFFDVFDELEKDRNKLWVKSEQFSRGHKNSQLDRNWIGYINLNDMSLNQDLEILKFPTIDNFPVVGYAINAITNAYGTSLYVTGGELYSKSKDKFLVSDSFYKYNFTSKDWVNMNNIVKGKLSPLTYHKSFAIDNRYLMTVGGVRPETLEEMENSDPNSKTMYKFNSIHDLQLFDTFTNSWENIKLNSTVVDTSVSKIDFYDYLAKVYKGQILALGGLRGDIGLNRNFYNNHIGLLDVKAKSWTWTPMIDETGYDTFSTLTFRDFQIFKDQIIMFSDYYNDVRSASVLVYDLPSKRTKSTLRLSDVSKENDPTLETKETQDQPQGLPTYAIALISVGCIAFALILSYLAYRKYKNKSVTKNNAPIREVWSNPNNNISQKTYMWDKSKGIYINPNMPGAPGFYDTGHQIDTPFNSRVIEFSNVTNLYSTHVTELTSNPTYVAEATSASTK